jgi:cobalamin biosynthesis Mg chelatase CobN
MRWAELRLVFVFFIVLVASGASSATVAFAQSDASSDADARRFFEEGRTAYEAGNFEAAVRGFRRAYLLSPRPALLYNIGQAELRAGHDALALEALEGFVRQAPPEDGRRGEVEERVRVLRSMGVRPASEAEAEAAQQAVGLPTDTSSAGQSGTETSTATTTTSTSATSTSSTSTATTPAATDSGPGIAPWIVVGAGGAVLVVGAVLMGVASGDASRVANAGDGASWSELRGVADGAQTMWGVGIAMIGVGIAAAGAGLVWALLPSGGSSGSTASARLRLAPGSVFVEGEF